MREQKGRGQGRVTKGGGGGRERPERYSLYPSSCQAKQVDEMATVHTAAPALAPQPWLQPPGSLVHLGQPQLSVTLPSVPSGPGRGGTSGGEAVISLMLWCCPGGTAPAAPSAFGSLEHASPFSPICYLFVIFHEGTAGRVGKWLKNPGWELGSSEYGSPCPTFPGLNKVEARGENETWQNPVLAPALLSVTQIM